MFSMRYIQPAQTRMNLKFDLNQEKNYSKIQIDTSLPRDQNYDITYKMEQKIGKLSLTSLTVVKE